MSILEDKYDCTDPEKLIKWEKVFDPQFLQSSKDRMTTVIRTQYIRPFQEKGESRHSSMILYGPPGTAKTTLAQALASELGWIFVNITPSDFVKKGIEESESMARTLFNDLLRLRKAVVLFDEIDEMLRSRSTPEMKDQVPVAMLRFLIPGMLPKLQRLKQYGEKAGVIFIIATNYADSLDEAVVRAGRIDLRFVVPPPDEPSRQFLFFRMLGEQVPLQGHLDDEGRMKLAKYLASKTHGWVYRELDDLAERVSRLNVVELMDAVGKDGLDKVLEVEKLDAEGWEGYGLLGLKRSLKLEQIYHKGRRRKEAEEEARMVLKICQPQAKNEDVKAMLDKLFATAR